MNKIKLALNTIAVFGVLLLGSSFVQAQATRTWVSGVGDDVNPCSRTAPCKTWAGAISKTAAGGEIDALDPGGFGAVTITKSITLDGTPFQASSLNSAINGIIINVQPGDANQTVILRGLTIQGAGTTPGTRGVDILAGKRVFILNCVIQNQLTSPGNGIEDSSSTGGFVEIDNTAIFASGGDGIHIDPSSGSTQINLHLSNSYVQKSAGSGLFLGSNVHATIFNSVITQNVNSGIFAQQTAGGSTDVSVDRSVVSANVTGFQAATANAAIRVSNSTAVHNVTLATIAGGGIVSSYGNNQTSGVAFPSPGTGSN